MFSFVEMAKLRPREASAAAVPEIPTPRPKADTEEAAEEEEENIYYENEATGEIVRSRPSVGYVVE